MPNYQRGHQISVHHRDQVMDLSEEFTDASQSSDTTSGFLCLGLDLLASTSTILDLPPSLAAANESHQAIGTVLCDDPEGTSTEVDDASDQVAAITPFSFHHRTLQMAMPRMPYDLEAWSEEVFSNTSSSQRVDSATGSPDDPYRFDRPVSEADFTFPSNGVEQDDSSGSPLSPLQYHLIQMKSKAELKENVAPLAQRHSSVEDSLPMASNNLRTLSCHLCPDKQYTGTWAHRNLTRHMESVHAPCSSPDGKQIRCSHKDCRKTFRRDDARLVHERRSHPDLNRAPATKRKRSDDV